MIKTSILLAAMVFPLTSFASMFTVSKTVNAKNVLHYEASVKSCQFIAPYVTAKWIMGEERGQTEGLTARESKYLKPKVTYAKETEYDFTLDAVKELKTSGTDFRKIKVRMINCKPRAFTEYQNQEIELVNINLKTTMLSVTGATITGKKADGSRFILNLTK